MSQPDAGTRSVAASAGALPVEQALLLDEACNAFEAKWRAGGRPDVWAAVLELPEALRSTALKELVALDVFYRRKVGERPAAAAYASKFPDLDADWLAGVVGEGLSAAGTPDPDRGEARGPAAWSPGAVIAGKYTLVEPIGEGGMGTVYRARQSHPVKRNVALKLVKGGLDSKTVLARFDAERQALALMDHPNIARVYDGGTTGSGQPFFVMELIAGVPLTQFCDQKQLRIPARLELFVQVCQAVQHAHQKGIIHRDIKPSNVLVAEIDGRPTPKVIDFGVAKATERRLTDLSLGETGSLVGTPAYMSPEQAGPFSADIDTRTDVYALGVVLYELLTGSPPLEARDFARGAVLELLRLVREADPPRPSTKVGSSAALPSIAANRNVEPAKLARLLRGELDWVVMKCLEKDRTRRYPTALGLAQDIQRYLADEVVEARPPGRGYRLRKFVRRNKGQVVAAGLIGLTLAGGVVGTTLALVEARHAAGRADAQADKARQEAARADREADEARRRAEEEKKALGRAKESEARAKESEARAKRGERLAKEANHAIKLDLALRARELNDWDRVRELLDETHADYGQTFENRFVRALWRLRGLPVRAATGHAGHVGGVAFGPDGRRVATASWDRTAKLWDAETGAEVRTLRGHAGFVTSVAFSPDGTLVATGSWDRTAKLWDAGTGTEKLALTGHAHYVLSVAFSRDGRRVATGGYDNAVRIWDARTGAQLHTLADHADPVWGVAFNDDGTRVVAASGTAPRVWDVHTGKERLALRGHPGPVTCVAFSPDGKFVAAGGNDRTVRVWDAHTGAERLALQGHTSWVAGVAFSADGTRVVTGGHDNTVRLWDAETGSEKLTLAGHTNAVTGVAFSPDGHRIVSGSWDQSARVWSAERITERHVLTHTGAILGVTVSPDGTRIATGGAKDDQPGEVRVWDAQTGAEKVSLRRFAEPVRCVAFSPDGKLLATGGGSFEKDKYGELKLWDGATGEEKLAFRVPTGAVTRVTFGADGRRLLTHAESELLWDSQTGHRGASEQLWDARTGNAIALEGQGGELIDAAFGPGGRLIGCTSHGNWLGQVKVWSAETGKELFALPGEAGAARCAAFSPDGKRIVTAGGWWGKPTTVNLWDAETGTRLSALKGAVRDAVRVWYSPGGKWVLVRQADALDRIWEPATGEERDLLGRAVGSHGVFGPDDRLFLVGSRNAARAHRDRIGEVLLWEMRPRAAATVFAGHRGVVNGVALSPDGKFFVTASDDGTARVWQSPAPPPPDLRGFPLAK